jgi:hypothetical protein
LRHRRGTADALNPNGVTFCRARQSFVLPAKIGPRGLPYNNPSLTAPPPILGWQTMADVLEGAGLPWKCYSVADGSIPSAIGAFNPLVFFSQISS